MCILPLHFLPVPLVSPFRTTGPPHFLGSGIPHLFLEAGHSAGIDNRRLTTLLALFGTVNGAKFLLRFLEMAHRAHKPARAPRLPGTGPGLLLVVLGQPHYMADCYSLWSRARNHINLSWLPHPGLSSILTRSFSFFDSLFPPLLPPLLMCCQMATVDFLVRNINVSKH